MHMFEFYPIVSQQPGGRVPTVREAFMDLFRQYYVRLGLHPFVGVGINYTTNSIHTKVA
jgi:outer membrane protein W